MTEKAFDAAADVIAATPDTAGENGWRDRLIAAAKEYVGARERMTGLSASRDGNVLVVTLEEARRMRLEGPKIVGTP